MGATLYFHVTPHTSPEEALLVVQSEIVEEYYDLETLVQTKLEVAQNELDVIDADDECGLRDELEAEVEYLRNLVSAPVPSDLNERIAYVQAVYKFDECGLGNILDIRGVSKTPQEFMAYPVNEQTIVKIIGRSMPRRTDVRKIIDAIHESLGRGECVYFSIFSEEDTRPIGLCFVGNTVD